MRLHAPRIPPLPETEWTEEQRALVQPMTERGPISGRPLLNIFRTFLRMPDAFKAFLAYGNYILSKKNSLPAREREIAILRVGCLCRSGYEWTQHAAIGKACGLSDAEIARIKAGADAPGWSAADAALLRASDELVGDKFISTLTWEALGAHFSDAQRIDLILTVGQYTQVSMFLNTIGVQLDPGQSLDPDLAAFEDQRS
ncbi:MAG: carboxymuconolactone decarboxylase family protein [Alphaproteobacteria bacterium]|nr:carboxymuconolactone decarboxylase family protein [Alphaproteobacteria bacterium]